MFAIYFDVFPQIEKRGRTALHILDKDQIWKPKQAELFQDS